MLSTSGTAKSKPSTIKFAKWQTNIKCHMTEPTSKQLQTSSDHKGEYTLN